MTVDEIRRYKLELLVSEYGGIRKLAEHLGKDEAQVAQWVKGTPDSKTGRPRGMRSDMARFIETRCGKPRTWLDTKDDADKDIASGTRPEPPRAYLSPGQAFVVDSIKDFDQDKIFKVVQAIGHIKDGKDVAPVQDPQPKPLFKDLMKQFMESAGPEELADLRGLLAGQPRSDDGTDAKKGKTSLK